MTAAIPRIALVALCAKCGAIDAATVLNDHPEDAVEDAHGWASEGRALRVEFAEEVRAAAWCECKVRGEGS